MGGQGGGLTIAKCDAIQNFYGKSLRDNRRNVEEMSKATWAILDHYSSTQDKPMHDNCPKGEDSWCSYNRDETTGKRTHKLIKNPLRGAVREAMIPLFTRLAAVTFLEGCKDCVTQNPNESLHNVIWSLAPKQVANSPHETSLGINLGVCIYNEGWQYTVSNMFEKLRIPFFAVRVEQCRLIDEDRIYDAETKSQRRTRTLRKELKRSTVKKISAFQHAEGPVYKSGAHHVTK